MKAPPQKKQPCPLCQGEAPLVFQHRVLETSVANIHLCPDCDYLFAAQPDWLDRAYGRVINLLDTGCLARTESMREETALPLYLLGGEWGTWLDYGGGHGAYVRRMRDAGFDFRWHDPKAENLFAGGFEDQGEMQYHGVTSFECLEHFTDPKREIIKMLSLGPRIIFSTEIRPESVPSAEDWWYYGWEHGQHVGFHSIRSLNFLAGNFNLKLVTSGRSLNAFLPPGEADSLAARLIRRGKLSLTAWGEPPFRKLFSPVLFLRSLAKGRILAKDFVRPIERRWGSKTLTDHHLLRSRMASGSLG